MSKFNDYSNNLLEQVHPDLQRLFRDVVSEFDCTVLCGWRGQAEQDEAYRTKMSKLKWPYSKHNKYPATAIDVIPYPLDWKDINRMYYFAGYVKAKAKSLNIKIIWGGDWDGDTKVNDQSFIDLPHWELI
jgi:hypothetical protein